MQWTSTRPSILVAALAAGLIFVLVIARASACSGSPSDGTTLVDGEYLEVVATRA